QMLRPPALEIELWPIDQSVADELGGSHVNERKRSNSQGLGSREGMAMWRSGGGTIGVEVLDEYEVSLAWCSKEGRSQGIIKTSSPALGKQDMKLSGSLYNILTYL
ncbi:hypothetical protein LTR75_017285, partial [Friedmanniomyces endolithicus]